VRGIVANVMRRDRLDLLAAIALTLAGVLETLLAGGDDGRLVRTLALPLATLPLAWRRDAPLLPPAGVAVSLLLQVWLGDFFAAEPVITLVAILPAVYSAGRYAASARAVAGAAVLMAVIAGTRIAFDPAVDGPAVAVMTVIAVGLPFLVGRWVRMQSRLQRELEQKAARRERERERDARDAAEEERMRIAIDLQAAVADRLSEVVRRSRELPALLGAGDHAVVRELLATIAGSAREALADVRRVLGILRRDGTAPRAPSPPIRRSSPRVGLRLSRSGPPAPTRSSRRCSAGRASPRIRRPPAGSGMRRRRFRSGRARRSPKGSRI